MARSKEVDVLTNKLIRLVTGFEEDEENFALSLEFVKSNFRYRRFLDTDAHKVKRMLEGIREKFVIHCQDEKANAFSQFCECFLHEPMFAGEKSENSDVHFAVLHLLLLLADSPTKARYEKPKPKEAPASAEKFDWGAYLREGEDPILSYVDDESPPISEDEDFEDMTVVPLSSTKASVKRVSREIQPRHLQSADQHSFPRSSESQTRFGSKVWLHENLMTCYWLGEVSKIEPASARSLLLNSNWQHYLSQVNTFYVPPLRTKLTEYRVIREILWLLGGARDLFVFKWNGRSYEPNEAILIDHLTDNAFLAFLQHLSHYGTVIHKFEQFVDSVTNSCCDYSPEMQSESSTCRTYQAFGDALFEFLQKLRHHLIAIETRACQQEETMTLSSVEGDLSAIFRDVDFLNLLFTKGIESCQGKTSASQKALTLLGVIYQMLIDVDRQNLEDTTQMSLLLLFWTKTCRPYIEIIDSWVFKGLLLDPFNEFLIQRNDNVQLPSERFWDAAFSLTCDTSAISTDQQESQYSGEEPTSGSDVASDVSKASAFLLPVLREIILTGKSMELVKALGRIKDVVGAKECDCLYIKYVDSLKSQLLSNDERRKDDRTLKTSFVTDAPSGASLGNLFTGQLSQHLQDSRSYDPLLQLNFEQIFSDTTRSTPLDQAPRDSWLSVDHVDSPVSLQWTLQTCLYSLLISQCRLVSSTLLHILKEEYKMLDYFAAVRRFFLMEAGGAMYEFYTAIFDKIRLHEPWKNVSFVNMILQEALQLHHHDDRERLFLTFSEDEKKTAPVASDSLDNMVLHYKISWPVDIVITSQHMRTYNKVFLFLLQIKHAKYILDRLRFSDLEVLQSFDVYSSEPDLELDAKNRRDIVHRLHLFRVRLLHFVNSLHDYIMTRILHSVGMEFQRDMESAVDLDNVISTHNAYVECLHERCLLHKKATLIRDVIMQVLGFAKTVEGLWNNDNGPLRVKILTEVESRFTRCINFLSSMIQKVTTRGTFPHLESLAFALVTCSESLRQKR